MENFYGGILPKTQTFFHKYRICLKVQILFFIKEKDLQEQKFASLFLKTTISNNEVNYLFYIDVKTHANLVIIYNIFYRFIKLQKFLIPSGVPNSSYIL